MIFEMLSKSGMLDTGSAKREPFYAQLEPEVDFYAIGDIHGAAFKLDTLLDLIDKDMVKHKVDMPNLVFLGDYIDRGPYSRIVLRMLRNLKIDLGRHVTCLMGNHERMMLDFIHNPLPNAARWLRHGGSETLASFDIHGITEKSSRDEILDAHDRFEDTIMEDGTLEFVGTMKPMWQSGNVVCAHAGIDPTLKPAEQDPSVMIWGPPDFLDVTRKDRFWVVHGHHIVKEPTKEYGRINLDTGAYQTGRLTAGVFRNHKVEFLTA